jgi:hypothetical protein
MIRDELLVNLERQSYMLGFHIESPHLYGLPERKLSSRLNNTDNSPDPYRLFSIDKFPHDVWDP